MRYKLTIEYDGTNYVGWQKQPDQPNNSIEELLQKAIYDFSSQNVKINCAGRTDSGVHAVAQIADFELEKDFREFRILMALNNNLRSSDISILKCEKVLKNFHSRFDAKNRSYLYRIINRRAPLKLEKNRAFHIPTKLNIEAMQQGAKHLIGEHDFSSFRDAKCQSISAIKTVDSVNISTQKILAGEEISISISAKSFLHHMVRNIVGTLVLVGQEKILPQDVESILQAKDRTKSGPNAPACGLYFLGAKY